MESSGLFDSAVRVKEEPSDVSLSENNYEMIDEKPDLEKVQLLPFLQGNPISTLQKRKKTHESELDDEVEIVVECEDVKPKVDLDLLFVQKKNFNGTHGRSETGIG
ncbi:hypothetical protein TKK_0018448 [Trichogramma kaykai]